MSGTLSPLRVWWIKITNFEFWPFDFFYFPVKFYYLWLAWKSRSLFFFTASNPNIEFGGMLGERKSEVFKLIPARYIPKTLLFSLEATLKEIRNSLKDQRIEFPFIAKPDIGERGWMVQKIHDDDELDQYFNQIKVPFLIQEYVDYPVELGVFYIKIPGQKGRVTSVVRKGLLHVLGDGKHSVQQLLERIPRARLQVNFSDTHLQEKLTHIPKRNESFLVEEIGNHCRGTIFFNDSNQIDEELTATFQKISDEILEFYFGRFDIRCQSMGDLKQGKNFKILELNGAGSEPGHIYQPGYPLLQAYKDVLWHLKQLYIVSKANNEKGVPYWDFAKGWKKWKEILAHNKTKQA